MTSVSNVMVNDANLWEFKTEGIKAYASKDSDKIEDVFDVYGEIFEIYDTLKKDDKLYTFEALCKCFSKELEEEENRKQVMNLEVTDYSRVPVEKDGELTVFARVSDNWYKVALRMKVEE